MNLVSMIEREKCTVNIEIRGGNLAQYLREYPSASFQESYFGDPSNASTSPKIPSSKFNIDTRRDDLKQSTNIFEHYYVDLTHGDVEKRLAAALQKNGLVTFDHIRSREHLVAFSHLLGTVFHHRDSSADGVTCIANTGEIDTREGFSGFSSSALTFHTDRSSALEPPTLILLLCSIQAQEGGASLLADARAIWEELQRKHPDVLEKLSATRSAIFMDSEQPL